MLVIDAWGMVYGEYGEEREDREERERSHLTSTHFKYSSKYTSPLFMYSCTDLYKLPTIPTYIFELYGLVVSFYTEKTQPAFRLKKYIQT